QGCPDGHFQRNWYNSCKHRICPQCAWLQITRWLEKKKEQILGCDHFHMIFTIPHDLNFFWYINPKLMSDLLFKGVKETLEDFFKDPRHLGATPGIIASLHTWTQTLIRHPHIHCLITGGGLGADNIWRKPANRDGFLLPSKAVMKKFRGKMLALIDAKVKSGELPLPKTMSIQQWTNLKNKLGRKVKWNVRIQNRYKHGNGVLTYLARYIRGGPISNNRILKIENKTVLFRYRVNGAEGKKNSTDTIKLPIDEFINRFMQHVPEKGHRVVRAWGLYSPTKKKELDCCRKIFGQLPAEDAEFLSWQDAFSLHNIEEPAHCPQCGKKLMILADICNVRGVVDPTQSTFMNKMLFLQDQRSAREAPS
ncbi:MAG: transposase, partial [bacterium]|nr:transposase [bacterium]